MSAVTAKVAGIKPIGAGKVAQIGFDINGAIETRKAWATEKDGSPSWVEGQTYTIEFFEQENNFNGNTTMEKWAKKAQAPRAGGGGRPAPKGDPERTAIERERLNTYQQNSEINRQRDDYKQCLIIAQVCAKAAVDLYLHELAHGESQQFNPTTLKRYASEVAAVIASTADEIQHTLSIAPINRSGQ